MAVRLEFFVNLNTNVLSKSDRHIIGYSLPELIAGDTVQLAIGLVEDNPTAGPGVLSRSTISGYSCRVAIGTEGAAPHTSATLSVSSNLFVGTLPLNVAAIANLFTPSPAAPLTRTFEMEFADSTGTLTIKRTVTLRNELLTTSLVDPPAPDVALGKAEAGNLYLKRAENAPGAGFILVSPDGTQKAYVYLDDEAQLQVSPLT